MCYIQCSPKNHNLAKGCAYIQGRGMIPEQEWITDIVPQIEIRIVRCKYRTCKQTFTHHRTNADTSQSSVQCIRRQIGRRKAPISRIRIIAPPRWERQIGQVDNEDADLQSVSTAPRKPSKTTYQSHQLRSTIQTNTCQIVVLSPPDREIPRKDAHE